MLYATACDSSQPVIVLASTDRTCLRQFSDKVDFIWSHTISDIKPSKLLTVRDSTYIDSNDFSLAQNMTVVSPAVRDNLLRSSR